MSGAPCPRWLWRRNGEVRRIAMKAKLLIALALLSAALLAEQAPPNVPQYTKDGELTPATAPSTRRSCSFIRP